MKPIILFLGRAARTIASGMMLAAAIGLLEVPALGQPPAGDPPTSGTEMQTPPLPNGPAQGPPMQAGPGQGRGQRRGYGAGRGGFGPGGPNRGFGPGPGAPGYPPPPVDSPDEFRQRWARLDGGRLLELTSTLEALARNFDVLETDRAQALDELDKARNGFDQNQMDPATVLRRQQIERLLGRLHDTVEQQRLIQSHAGWLLNLIDDNKTFVKEMLGRADTAPRGGERITGPRATRWNNAMAALDNNQRPRWARLLLGDTLGPLALRWAGQEAPGDNGPPLGPPGSDASQQRTARRQEQIDDLVKRVMELNATVERQGQEIQQLKRMMTGTATPTPVAPGK